MEPTTPPPPKSKLPIVLGLVILSILVLVALYHQSYLRQLLPSKPSYALSIDNKIIDYDQYNQVLNHVQSFLKDRQKSIERTNYLFIANELLNKELTKQGQPFTEANFQAFLDKQGFGGGSTAGPGYRLEKEVEYLKDQLFNKSLSWYSGFYFIAHFKYPDLPGMTETARKESARKKIEQIHKDLLAGASLNSLDIKYATDQQLKTLNAGQSYAASFEKRTVGNPPIGAPELDATIPKLKKGEVSDIFTISDPNRGNTPFAFVVLKITDSNQGIASSFETWYESAKKPAKIVILIK